MQSYHYEVHIKNNAEFINYQPNTRITTVAFSASHDKIRHNFKCTNCGKLMFKYNDVLQSIVEAVDLNPARYHDVMCNRCNIIYRIVII